MRILLLSVALAACAGPSFAENPRTASPSGGPVHLNPNAPVPDANDQTGQEQWDEDVQRTFQTVRKLKREMKLLAHENDGLKALLAGDPGQAKAAYDSLLELAPDRADALVYRAGAKSALGDHEGALADYTTAIGQAWASLEKEKDPAARKKTRAFVARIHGDRASTRMRIGIRGKGDDASMSLALADCDEALSVGHPRPSLMTWQKSQILFAMDRYEEAAKDYQQALVLDPKLKELSGHASFCRRFSGEKIAISSCD